MTDSIAKALFSRTQQRVLGLLYGQPQTRFYTNEIMRRANMGRGTIRRELTRLVDAGILSTMRQGNQVYYQANPECPVYPELLGIVRKTFGVADIIREALRPLDEKIRLAFVYGSMAKGTDSHTSDIDLMIIGEALAYSDVMDRLLPLEKELMRPVNPTVYSLEEFRSKLAAGNGFLNRVMEQPRLWVKGSDDDIGEAG